MKKKTRITIGILGAVVAVIGFIMWAMGIFTRSAFSGSGFNPLMIVAFFMFAVGGLVATIFLARRLPITNGVYIPLFRDEDEEDTQIRCPSCKKKIDGDAPYCSYCGATVAVLCPICGQALDNDAAFCKHCGTKIS